GGVASSRGVLGPGEEQQQRVSAELQKSATVLVRDGKQPSEGRVQDLGDFLGTDLALLGQALGQLGEPRDVDENEGALDRAGRRVRRFSLPVGKQTRNVGS